MSKRFYGGHREVAQRGQGSRRLLLEFLEPRVLLSGAPDVTAVWAQHRDFRFIVGGDPRLPAVTNTYAATVTGDVTSVTFQVGDVSASDTDPSDGWSAALDMSEVTVPGDLVVTAYGPGGQDQMTFALDMVVLPDWMGEPDVSFTASHSWDDGYSFDVTLTHYEEGFYTPDEWCFNVPGTDITLIDLSGLWTGFNVSSLFTLNSTPAGTVLAEDYRLVMSADVLGHGVFERAFDVGTSGSVTYQQQWGGVSVSGSVDYSIGLNPSFNNELLLDGISGTVTIDPELSITVPLGEVRVPLLWIPGVADAVFGAEATATLGCDSGDMVTLIPEVTNGGIGLEFFRIHPTVSAAITGYGEAEVLVGLGTAGADLTGTLSQSLEARYERAAGWSVSAPGSLSLSASAYAESFWGLGPSGTIDLFEVEVASWDFLAGSGDSPDQTETLGRDDQVLQAQLSSPLLGYEGAGAEFRVNYTNTGSSAPPQAASLIIDNVSYEMELVSGQWNQGVFSCDLPDLEAGPHEFNFIFVDPEGNYYVSNVLSGLTDDAFRGNHSLATAAHINRLQGTYAGLVLVPDASGSGSQDWFSFYIQGDAPVGSQVVVQHDPAYLVDLSVRDSNGNEVGSPVPGADGVEAWDLSGLPAGLYYVCVSAAGAGTCPSYDLSFAIPEEGGNLTLVEVLDRSGSMSDSTSTGTKLSDAKTAARLLVDQLMPGDRIGVVSYSSTARTDFPLATITTPSSQPQTLFYDPMESLANWIADPPWGLSADSPHGGNFSVTDSPGGDYDNYTDTSLTLSSPLLLPADEPATLTFWTRYELESSYDYGYIEASTDGIQWEELGSLNGYQSSWVQESYSLAGYAGQDIRLRFRLDTDCSITYDGWYIDDVEIQTGVAADVQGAAKAAIDSLDSSGSTSIGAGVLAADQQLDRFPGDPLRVMVVMTDGLQNTDPEPIGVINSEVDQDIRIFTVGFGDDADEDLLSEMAALRNGTYYHAEDLLDMQVFYSTLKAATGASQQVLSTFATITPGAVDTHSFQVDPSARVVTVGVSWGGSDLDLALLTPDGTVISPQTAQSDPDIDFVDGGTYELYQITAPQAGGWQMQVAAVDVPQTGEEYHAYSMVASPVRAVLSTDRPAYQPGQPMDITLSLTDGQPITGADVAATITPPPGSPLPPAQLLLLDDGLHNDGAANDGTYGARFYGLNEPGNYQLTANAQGTSRAGFPFTRSPSAQVVVSGQPTPAPDLIDSFTYFDDGWVTVGIYDANPNDGVVPSPEIAWNRREYVRGQTDLLVDPGRLGDGVINSVTLLGDGTETADIGIIVANAQGLRAFVDRRTAVPPEIGFIACDGYINTISLRSGMTGGNINGFYAEGGWAMPADLDNDTSTADLTAIFANGRIRSATVRGELLADVVTGDRLDRLVSYSNLAGGITAAGQVRRLDIRGDWFGSLRALTIGSISARGQLSANIQAQGLDPRSGVSIATMRAREVNDTTITAPGRIRTISALQWTNGSINAASLDSLRITGSRRAPIPGDFSADLTLTGNPNPRRRTLGRVTIAGAFTGDWNITGNVGSIRAGNTDGWNLTVASEVRYLSLAEVQNTNLDVEGPIRYLRAISWDGGSIEADWISSLRTTGSRRPVPILGDFSADITLSGNSAPRGTVLASASIAGTVDQADWELAGRVGRLTAAAINGGAITADSIGSLRVAGNRRYGVDGNCSADITLIGANAPRGYALSTATVADAITAGTWDIENGNVGTIRFAASAPEWELSTPGHVRGIYASELLSGTIDANSIGTLNVRGQMWNAHLDLKQAPDPRQYAARTILVRGWVADSSIISAGNIRLVRLGASLNSVLFAGVRETALEDIAAPDGVFDLPDPALDLALGPDERARVGTLAVVGIRGEQDCIINSNLAAAEIGFLYTFGAKDWNHGVRFGVAADYIRRFIWEDEGEYDSFTNLSSLGDTQVYEDCWIWLA